MGAAACAMITWKRDSRLLTATGFATLSIAMSLPASILLTVGVPNGFSSSASLDSLQAITLAELIRREMHREISVRDILNSVDLQELANTVDGARLSSEGSSSSSAPPVRGNGIEDKATYRVYMMRFAKSPVDWVVNFTGLKPL